MYVYHLYNLGEKFPSDKYHPMDLYDYEAAIYDLTKIERKLRTFWFYEGRHITFEEAVTEGMINALEAPKFRPKRCLEIPKDL